MLKNKNVLLIGLALILLLGGVGVAYVKYHKSSNASKTTATRLPNVDYTPATTGDNQANEDRKSQPPSKNDVNGQSTSSSDNSNPIVTITRAGVVDSNLQVAALVNGATSGTCSLTVSQQGQQSVTATENVQLQNSSYVCPVFNVPLSRFPNHGAWNVSVAITSNSKSSTSNWQANPVQLTP